MAAHTVTAIFQSTPSARRATEPWLRYSFSDGNFNPRPPRGERRACPSLCPPGTGISIHALREESDRSGKGAQALQSDFNPRPPRGERQYCTAWMASTTKFQSTPSARRATMKTLAVTYTYHISIHALREESDALQRAAVLDHLEISIHALREESDPQRRKTSCILSYFNPRPPRGERRWHCGRSYRA